MAVPYTFGSATTSIPLSQLDSNFATTITLGNTAIQLGNTVTTLNNMTLGNVTISSGTSNIQTNVANATGVLLEANGGTGTTTGYYSFKNRLINGAMVIDQRNAGASYTQVNGLYNLDRWQGNTFDGGAATNKFSVIQSSTAPTGFSKSLLVTSLAATASAASNIFNIQQQIEGFNFADFMYGTANAQTLTLSFWVRSSLTGTFGGALKNNARDRAYPFTYTISTANTFEQKTVTITGDTTGTWVGATNSTGLWISFGLGVGSTYSGTAGAWGAGDLFSATGATSVVGTNGATFYITGVQLEKGSTATSFDYRPYGTELALCQRYYQVYGSVGSTGTNGDVFIGTYRNSSTLFMPVQYEVPMRTTPSFTQISVSGAQWSSQTQDVSITGFSLSNTPTTRTAFVQATSSSAFSAGNGLVYTNSGTTTNAFSFSAEL